MLNRKIKAGISKERKKREKADKWLQDQMEEKTHTKKMGKKIVNKMGKKIVNNGKDAQINEEEMDGDRRRG